MAAHSPASSPRLPSPPPMAEDQTMPTSPGVSLFEDHGKFPGAPADGGASRRIRPGTKSEDMAEGPPLVPLQDIDSAFPLTEHLKALHYSHTHPPDSTITAPITADIARRLSQPPPNTGREIWLYELGRFLIQKTNAVIVALFADHPPCSAQTCPEMRASEWQYLCAVHDPPKNCSAIDYSCHTLDWAAATLTSNKMFPSRLGLGSGLLGAQGDKTLAMQMKEITNIFRRVYRIYAHAWFQHREMFWRVEAKTGLYVFFKTVCDEYGIIQPDNYTIPREAEGLEPEQPLDDAEATSPQGPTVLKRDPITAKGFENDKQEPAGNETLAASDTTKRHRHTMSDRPTSVTTVIHEEAEEEDEKTSKDARPSLERQGTILRDFAEAPPQYEPPTAVAESAEQERQANGDSVDEDIESIPSISRSDTLRPPKEGEEKITEGDQTIIETHPVPEDELEDEPEDGGPASTTVPESS